MGKGGGMTTRGGRCGVGYEGITKLKTNVISAAAEKKQCVLLGEACPAAFQRVGTTFTTRYCSSQHTVVCVFQFCQPTGYSLSTQQQQPAFYVAVLTDIDADRHYCATLTFHETVAMTPSKPDDVDADDHDSTLIHHSLMYAPKSLVLVSRLDYFEAFRVGNSCLIDICIDFPFLCLKKSC